MANGVFLGTDSGVRGLTECYVGVSNAKKTVTAIYVGTSDGVKLIWPTGTNMLGDRLIAGYFKYDAVGDSVNTNGSVGTGAAYTGFWSKGTCIGGSSENDSISSSHRDCCHGFYTSNIDTRPYNYILARFLVWRYSGNTTTGRAKPFVSYGSTWTDNLTQYSSYISVYTRSSEGDIGTHGFYVLYDISKMRQSSASINFGCKLWTTASDGVNGCLYTNEIGLYQAKPSTSVDCTLTWS